jgi:hypothetical protein
VFKDSIRGKTRRYFRRPSFKRLSLPGAPIPKAIKLGRRSRPSQLGHRDFGGGVVESQDGAPS